MPAIDAASTSDVLLIMAALSAGAFVQGALGFGSAIVAVPAMIWGGLTLPEAVTAALAAVVVQTSTGCWQFRIDLVKRDVLTMFGYRILALPVGLAVMATLASMGASTVKQAVGAVVLVSVALVWADRSVEKVRPHRAWTPIAGLTSGLLAGSVGMGGPPLVLWAHARHWSTRRCRVFLWGSFLLISPVQVSLMGWKFGPGVWWMALWGVAATPLVIAAGRLGARTGDRLSREQFRVAALVLLALMGLTSLLSPWLPV